jgi:hypothetical protein
MPSTAESAADTAFEAFSAQEPESRWAIGAAAFLSVLWIGVVAVAALVFGSLRCLGDNNGPAEAICEAGSPVRTISELVAFWLPLLAAIAAGAFAVWRRSYRPVVLTAALLWVLPPVAMVLIIEISTKST